MRSRLVQIRLSYATFGVITEDGVVVEAAPIARWMEGKTEEVCAQWVRKKGGVAEVIAEHNKEN